MSVSEPHLNPKTFPRTRISAWTNAEGGSLDLNGFLRGSSVFLIAGGPSLNQIDLGKLDGSNAITLGVNNAAAAYRPNWWISVDEPSRFLTAIWTDPRITKLVRSAHRDSPLFDPVAKCLLERTPSDCPSVVFFESDLEFSETTFLGNESISWGTSSEAGGRSVLLAALKNLYHLGVQDVFLLGADFEMKHEQPYHFPESRTPEMVTMNNRSYHILAKCFDQLHPQFLEHDFHVWNCNPDSRLTSFPFLSFSDALKKVSRAFPTSLGEESTEGRYVELAHSNTSAAVFPETKGSSQGRTIRRIDRSKQPRVEEADPSVAPGEPQEDCEIVLLVDRHQEWLLPWWWHHFETHHSNLAVTLFSRQITEGARSWAMERDISVHELEELLPVECATWFYKPFAIQRSRKERVVFCDLDCEIRGSLLPLFEWCKNGIVIGRDLHPIGRHKKLFREGYYFNSGLIGCSPSSEVISAWTAEVERMHDIMRSDQEILNLVLYEQESQIIALPPHFHQLRLDGECSDATVMHWTGADGKAHIRRAMESLALKKFS